MSTPTPAATASEVVVYLRSLGSEENRAGMARFGIRTETALGIGLSELRPLAGRIKRDHERALALWRTGIREARLLAALTDEPRLVTFDQCRAWASDFDSWEIVDGVADLFVATPFWKELVVECAGDNREFVRRLAFAMLAWGAVHLKKEPDATFQGLLRLVEAHATDPHNFVRKAVNWALRQIGKRSLVLHAPALALADRLAGSPDRTARWIGRNAARELRSARILARLEAKSAATG